MTLEDKELNKKQIVYLNEKTGLFLRKDVKGAIMNFKEFLDKLDLSYMHERGFTNDMYDTIDVITKEFEKEFGKFQK